MSRRWNTRGFTLTELLLVCLILALTLGLLLPVLSAARKSSRLVVCTSNLRQLGMAYQMYAADYGALPRPQRLVHSAYLKDRRILSCPDDTHQVWSRAASSYRFRVEVPPAFHPYWEQAELDSQVVLLVCPHHQEQELQRDGYNTRTSAPRYPYKLVLRAGGAVSRVSADRVREVRIPADRPEYTWIYPGEPGYDQQKGGIP